MAQGYALQHWYSSIIGAINPRYHLLRDSLMLTVAGVGAVVIMYLSSGGAPSISSQNLTLGNNNQPQQSGQQSSSSLDGLVAETPTPFINTPTPYPIATATPNPDPYGAKALKAEINKTGRNATPDQLGAWARAALEMYPSRKDAEAVMAAAMYAAFSRSDYKGVMEIGRACAEWEGLTFPNGPTDTMISGSEKRYNTFQNSRNKPGDVEAWIWAMLGSNCLTGPP